MQTTETPIEAAVFRTIAEAQKVVRRLMDAGFIQPEITVICSQETKQRYFREFEHQEPAGTYTPDSALATGSMGAFLGGTAAVVATLTTGGVALVIGGLAALTGAVAGGLVGAMLSRGVERELANHYDQAVVAGHILIAVQPQDEDPLKLATARDIFAAEGAVPMPLREG